MADLLVRNVRVLGAEATDVAIRGGTIASVGPAPDGWDGPSLDGGGLLALPGLVDGHAHIDGTLWGQPWRPHASAPGLQGLIDGERALKADLPPTEERAGATSSWSMPRPSPPRPSPTRPGPWSSPLASPSPAPSPPGPDPLPRTGDQIPRRARDQIATTR